MSPIAQPLEIGYLGWSGVTIAGAGGAVAVDPFGAAAGWAELPTGPTAICLTHGHPEHCGSARALLSDAGPERLRSTHLISSPAVVRHVAGGRRLEAGHSHAVLAGERVRVDGLEIATFAWRHLPLLPPESLRAKVQYAARLARRPTHALRIAAAGVRLPMRAPYVGFHVQFADGRRVLDYAEGLHRLTDPGEVAAVVRELYAETVLFAVEPEDIVVIPRWLRLLKPVEAIIYEAHRPWRELFGLPHLELDWYASSLERRFDGLRVRILTEAGQRLRIDPPAADIAGRSSAAR